ncbi:MAG: phytoene desaturase family protein, partial [Bacteroidales bacterium]
VKQVDRQTNKGLFITTEEGKWNVDKVISDMDVQTFYSKVMKDDDLFTKNKQHEKSSSAMIFYWGVNGQFSQLNLHNIFFAENYQQEFQSLFDEKEIFSDPTIYVYISSKQVPSDAPNGKENWYVMINAPENVGQDWDRFKKQARKSIIAKLNLILNTNIEKYIEFERYMDPRDIEDYTSSFNGSLYGNSSNDKFAAFNRHPNFSKKFKDLYFVGGSVHPGGGIPLCLASAKIVSDKLK